MTASLDFKEFSGVNSNGEPEGIPFDYIDPLGDFLEAKFGCSIQQIIFKDPFLIIIVNDEKAPDSDRVPFLIAGLVSIWVGSEEPEPGDEIQPVLQFSRDNTAVIMI
jgi:hypothetical protein